MISLEDLEKMVYRLIFEQTVTKGREEGWDDDFLARQITDDLFRKTKDHDVHYHQHLVERMVRQVHSGQSKAD